MTKKKQPKTKNPHAVANPDRPHFVKCHYFEKNYPKNLIPSEWLYKFDLDLKTPTGRKMTYNPDYFCKETGYFIEVATSKPNIIQQGRKWARAISLGLKLKVYWWEGKNITKQIIRDYA